MRIDVKKIGQFIYGIFLIIWHAPQLIHLIGRGCDDDTSDHDNSYGIEKLGQKFVSFNKDMKVKNVTRKLSFNVSPGFIILG